MANTIMHVQLEKSRDADPRNWTKRQRRIGVMLLKEGLKILWDGRGELPVAGYNVCYTLQKLPGVDPAHWNQPPWYLDSEIRDSKKVARMLRDWILSSLEGDAYVTGWLNYKIGVPGYELYPGGKGRTDYTRIQAYRKAWMENMIEQLEGYDDGHANKT